MDIKDAVNKFDTVYKTVLIPKLSPIENYRKKQQKLANKFINILLPFRKQAIVDDYALKTKNNLFSIMLSCFVKVKTSNDVIDMDEIRDLGFCTNANDVKYGAMAVCTYKNNKIIFTEEKIQRNSKDKEDDATYALFNGLAIRIETGKNLNIKTILSRHAKNFSTSERENVYLGSKVNFKYNNKDKLETVKFETSEYGKMFDIFSNDETKTRKILTEKFLEKIKLTRDSFKTAGISIAIVNSDIYIFIEQDKFFFDDFNLDKEVSDKVVLKKIFENLVYLFNMINYFC